MIHFYDAATPENVPSGVHAAVYVNGYAWPEVEVKRMSGVFRVSVHREAYWARFARCIDVESGAATPQDALTFLEHRRALGFNDGTVYCNRSNWEEIRQLILGAHGFPEPLWWVATLDGTTEVPGAWAVQYYGGLHTPYDLSVLHGINNFHKP